MVGPKDESISWRESGVWKLVDYLEQNRGANGMMVTDQKTAMTDILASLAATDFDATSWGILRSDPDGGARRVREKYAHFWKSSKKPGNDNIKALWMHGVKKLRHQFFLDKFLPTLGDNPAWDWNDPTAPLAPAGPVVSAGPIPPPPVPPTNTDSDQPEDHMDVDGDDGENDESGDGEAPEDPTTEDSQAELIIEISKMIPDYTGDNHFDGEEDDRQKLADGFEVMAASLKTKSVEVADRITAFELRDDLEYLGREVGVAVEALIKEMGLPENQSVSLDLSDFPGPDAAPLLADLMGIIDDWDETRLCLSQAISSQKVSVNAFLRGLVGAAISRWVFNIKSTPLLTKHELKKHLLPLFPGRAEKLARSFDALLVNILPNHQGQANLWLDSLVQIFGRALLIRCNIAKLGARNFAFEMPPWNDKFGSGDQRVVMGILPSVKMLTWQEEERDEGRKKASAAEEGEKELVFDPRRQNPGPGREWRRLVVGWAQVGTVTPADDFADAQAEA